MGEGEEKVKRKEEESKEKEMRELEEMMSNLNPLAQEFVPSSLLPSSSSSSSSSTTTTILASPLPHPFFVDPTISAFASPLLHPPSYLPNHHQQLQHREFPPRQTRHKRSSGPPQAHHRPTRRTGQAQRDHVIRRTVYVSDIDHLVTEEQLASLFISCGHVVDCRICGDPKSVLRFAFIEFIDEEEARAALRLSGTMLGFYPVKVRPSKTAIAPVNPTFLPHSEDEREMCARTVYCTNINRKITQAELKLFFEAVCGKVNQLRMLGDQRHPTRIAFVEFVLAECATAALNCSGVVLGGSAIRVSPSKTPVRPRLLR